MVKDNEEYVYIVEAPSNPDSPSCDKAEGRCKRLDTGGDNDMLDWKNYFLLILIFQIKTRNRTPC